MKKSDISKLTAHVSYPAHKTNHPIAEANAGTKEFPDGKTHEEDVQLGEGLDYGAVALEHEKHKPRHAKQVGASSQEVSRGNQARRENGGADPEGECGSM